MGRAPCGGRCWRQRLLGRVPTGREGASTPFKRRPREGASCLLSERTPFPPSNFKIGIWQIDGESLVSFHWREDQIPA